VSEKERNNNNPIVFQGEKKGSKSNAQSKHALLSEAVGRGSRQAPALHAGHPRGASTASLDDLPLGFNNCFNGT